MPIVGDRTTCTQNVTSTLAQTGLTFSWSPIINTESKTAVRLHSRLIRVVRAVALAAAISSFTGCGGSAAGPTPLPAGPFSQKACGTLASGSFVLDADLSTPVPPCLTISGISVSLDCKGHTISGSMWIKSASNVLVTNCKMDGLFTVENVSGLSITNSTIASPVAFSDSSGLKLIGNTISKNPSSNKGPAVVDVAGGQNHVISNNTLDGGYHGRDLSGAGHDAGPTDVDDGILLIDTTGDTISGNSIANVFDAGIEGANGLRNAVISNNTISNAIFAGIGSYFCTAWEGNTISGNTVSQSESALTAIFSTASCPQARHPPAS